MFSLFSSALCFSNVLFRFLLFYYFLSVCFQSTFLVTAYSFPLVYPTPPLHPQLVLPPVLSCPVLPCPVLSCPSSSHPVPIPTSFPSGLGDRHTENVLIDVTNAENINCDFDCLFDKGLSLARPEIVPFRLTPNMVDAMVSSVGGGLHMALTVCCASVTVGLMMERCIVILSYKSLSSEILKSHTRL
jgi:Phosphatidylinositol 3- and 4-kinase